MFTRLARCVMALVLAFATLTMVSASTTAPASAASCYTWERSLSEGATGEDVRQLQIRVAGYPGYQSALAIDGEFGPATKAAVTRFQEAYGLGADGVAGSATYEKIYSLQDADCSPVNFDYSELNGCNSDWSGGKVSASEAKANALQVMWQLQALRHALGDQPLVVNGGFRSIACNDAVGGAGDSRHLYGAAADIGAGSQGFCAIIQQARNHGFGGLLGPGYAGHDDHVHADNRSGSYWSAPDCGV